MCAREHVCVSPSALLCTPDPAITAHCPPPYTHERTTHAHGAQGGAGEMGKGGEGREHTHALRQGQATLTPGGEPKEDKTGSRQRRGE